MTRRARGPETAEEFELVLQRTLALKRSGLTQQQLAERWGVAQPYVSRLMNGHDRSTKYEALFAKAVGVPVRTLWPEPYVPRRRGPAGKGQG